METHKATGMNSATLPSPEIDETVIHPDDQAHHVEHRLHQHLTHHPDYEFTELVIHRIPNGVCLEGRASVRPGGSDLDAEISQILGRCQIVNRIMLCHEATEKMQRELFSSDQFLP